jgi:hypothetical protein
MNRFKDFGSGADQADIEPVRFKLYDEEFECVKAIQGKFLIELISAAQDETDSMGSLKMINEFFNHVLTDESYKKFDALVRDKDRVVSVETLSEIVSWLMAEYTNRPNQQPEDSSPGQ